MSQVDRYKPYKGAAAGWGALIADTKNWLGSVVALGVVAGALRRLMHAVGMSSH